MIDSLFFGSFFRKESKDKTDQSFENDKNATMPVERLQNCQYACIHDSKPSQFQQDFRSVTNSDNYDSIP